MDFLKIKRDLTRVKRIMNGIRENPYKNFEVVGQRDGHRYIIPEMNYLRLPIRHPHGFYMHLEKLKQILINVLRDGRISREELPKNAPDYLEELVE